MPCRCKGSMEVKLHKLSTSAQVGSEYLNNLVAFPQGRYPVPTGSDMG